MRSTTIARPVAYAASRLPLLKGVPVLRLLALAEIALLTREHVLKLDRGERRRLVQLIRAGRGGRKPLSDSERDELATLVAKAEPRLLFGHAVKRLSPVPIPGRVLYGRRRPPRRAPRAAS